MSEFIKILDEAAGKVGFNLTPQQLEQFDTYYRMLVETNKVMNLTALTEPQDVAVKHFVDSLMAYDTYFPGKVLFYCTLYVARAQENNPEGEIINSFLCCFKIKNRNIII